MTGIFSLEIPEFQDGRYTVDPGKRVAGNRYKFREGPRLMNEWEFLNLLTTSIHVEMLEGIRVVSGEEGVLPVIGGAPEKVAAQILVKLFTSSRNLWLQTVEVPLTAGKLQVVFEPAPGNFDIAYTWLGVGALVVDFTNPPLVFPNEELWMQWEATLVGEGFHQRYPLSAIEEPTPPLQYQISFGTEGTEAPLSTEPGIATFRELSRLPEDAHQTANPRRVR